MPRLAAALLFSLLFHCGWELAAQEAASSVSPHTSVSTIRALNEDRLEAGESVKLQGTVIYADADGFSLHDGHFAIHVSLPPDVASPPVGALLEVDGTTGSNRPAGHLYPLVLARSLRQVNLSPPPAPLPCSLRDLSSFLHWDQFVVVEGFVIDHSWSEGVHRILLAAHDDWAVIQVQGTAEDRFRPDLLGARIRARGINQGPDHSPMLAMKVAAPEHWQVLVPGREDPFTFPELSVAQIASSEASSLPFVKVHGFVLHSSPQNHVFARERGGDAFRIAIFNPLEKPAPGAGLASPVLPFPGVSPGDEIEAIGVAADTGKDVGLRFCQVRIVATKATHPVAVPTTIPMVYEGRVTNQIVTLSGRLVERQQIGLGGNQFRSVLVLEENSRLLRCQLDSDDPDPYEGFRKNDLIEATGLIPGNPSNQPLYLLLKNKEDAVSRGLSPAALFRRVWLWGGLVVAGLVLLLLWVQSLRRSLARAERAENAERVLNATLEDRVHARTLELESARTDLDRALDQERELGALKDRFVAMVSHEFRTPLGVTMSALELLRHHRARLDQEKQGELLDDIFSATLRMSGLMEQILLLGRAESGKMKRNPSPLDLPVLVRRVISETLASVGTDHPVDSDFEGDLNPVSLDENLFRLMLGNLVSNAVKYSPEGGPVHVSVSREEDRIELKISDQGIGIPEADQPRLFEAFHRATNVGEISGTGLGLLLVKRCVEMHGGSITFTSRPGNGTTFRIVLPLEAE
ncbi:MAG: HAMP domain-containing histidine kinase [Verrucomicrobiae bacterium]|nr:HAMP domain-containing histidine kinase [Verrucomicrobiae bacterium]